MVTRKLGSVNKLGADAGLLLSNHASGGEERRGKEARSLGTIIAS